MKYIPLPTPVPTAGTVPEKTVEVASTGVFPCRRCQKDAEPGEKLRLISYYPFDVPESTSPYLGNGPIFVHDKCTEFKGSALPQSHLSKTLSLRGYDANHLINEAAVVSGTEADEKVKEMLQREDVHFVHGYHVKQGCFAFKVERDS